MHLGKRSLAVIVGMAASIAVVGVAFFSDWDADPAAAQPAQGSDIGSVSPTAETSLSAEDRAQRDLEQLVRGYYAAENAAYLDPSIDPSAALDPYLRNPASGARVADILAFRNAGHQMLSGSAEVHAVHLTALDLGADPSTATIDECHTLAANGIDGETGQTASFSNRRKTTWTAETLGDGRWRLKTYKTDGVGSC